MCGILQVFERDRPVDRDRFTSALNLMKHRGPDYTGAYFHEPVATKHGRPVHAASGHQRLSILDLDERSHQPFRRGGRALVFNGEIYNYRDLKTRLRTSAREFTTTGDTEVLFYGLQEQGERFLTNANGMWAFSYLNEQTGQLLAARDRYGKKPLFYFQDDKTFILSSTIQAIHGYLGTRARPNDAMFDSYLLHGVMYPAGSEETHFADIRQVLPGQFLQFDLGRWQGESRAYFDLTAAAKSGPPSDEELHQILHSAVTMRLVSDRKVGLLLSGGVDSTAVLSVICAAGLQEQVHCFIGETGKSDDALYAKKCVETLGIEATVVELKYGKNAFAQLMKMCRHHEKPFPLLGNSMAMSEMYEQIAQHDVRVVLDGSGGDELFGGYWDRHFPVAIREAVSQGDVGWLWECSRQTPEFASHFMTAMNQTTRKYTGIGLDTSGLTQRLTPAYVTLGLTTNLAAPLDPLPHRTASFTETLIRDAGPGGRLGEWIWHNDRNAMMSGIENRSPLLDYRLIPCIGASYATKFRGPWNKHQLRKAFDAFRQLPTQWRQQKQGFRWNRKAFLSQNRAAMIECIEGSSYLNDRFHIRRFLDSSERFKKQLLSSLASRLLCIAGLEAEMGFASGTETSAPFRRAA